MGLIQEFMEFLKEYKVLPLAIAFIIGGAATVLVQSVVNDIVMPFVGVFIPGGDWKSSVLQFGPVGLGVGPFLSALINFVIIAFVVFAIAKAVLKEEKVAKK
jgi:large conductance mechanosensitive channel